MRNRARNNCPTSAPGRLVDTLGTVAARRRGTRSCSPPCTRARVGSASGALVLGPVELLGRPVPAPPVVVHPAHAPRDCGSVAAIDSAHGGALYACGGRRGEVCTHSAGEVVVDQPWTRLAATVDLLAQPATDDRRGNAEFGSEVTWGDRRGHAVIVGQFASFEVGSGLLQERLTRG